MWRRLVPLLLVAACGGEQPSDIWASATWPAPIDERTPADSPSGPTSAGLIVRWEVMDVWGIERFTLRRDGESTFLARTRDGHEVRIDRSLPWAELESLRDRLRQAGCCELFADEAETSPGEGPRIRLQLRMPDLSCDLATPLEAWDSDAARGCEAALREIHARPRFRQ